MTRPIRTLPQSAANLPALLEEATRLLGDVQPPPPSLGRLEGLRGHLRGNRLHVAVLGQFKRGKSSLLNALLGAAVLPTAVLPLTSVPIFITSGRPASVRVHYKDERPAEEAICTRAGELHDRLFAVATEEANPHNRLGVDHIDVSYPAPLLADGTVLIDTPGIGSSHRHNTDTTLQFLPQCDAGFFVLSPDPPVTEAELAFLDEVKAQVPRLIFVLNKIDYIEAAERGKVVEFLRSVLQSRLQADLPPEIYCVSARQALTARGAGDPGMMAASGLAAFEEQVFRPLARQKTSLLQAAVARKAQAAFAEAQLDLGLAIHTLKMPVDELGTCLETFHRILPQFEVQRQAAQDLLAGDRKRVLANLEDEAEQLRRRAAQHLAAVIDAAFASHPAEPEAAGRQALATAIPAFFDSELSRLSKSFAVHIRAVFSPHQKRAGELIDAVRRTAAELFHLPWQPSSEEEFLELSRQPYWVTQEMAGALIPVVSGRFGWLLPPAKRLARLRARLLADADKLVARNVENLRWATLQNVETAFRRFAAELDRGLVSVIEVTHGSIAAAYERRRAEAGRIDPQVDHLSSIAARLAVLGDGVRALAADEDGAAAGWSAAPSSREEGLTP